MRKITLRNSEELKSYLQEALDTSFDAKIENNIISFNKFNISYKLSVE